MPFWGYVHWYLLLPPYWVQTALAVLFVANAKIVAGTVRVSRMTTKPGVQRAAVPSLPPTGTTVVSCWPHQCSWCLASQCQSSFVSSMFPKSESPQIMGDAVRVRNSLFCNTGPETLNQGWAGLFPDQHFPPGAASVTHTSGSLGSGLQS